MQKRTKTKYLLLTLIIFSLISCTSDIKNSVMKKPETIFLRLRAGKA